MSLADIQSLKALQKVNLLSKSKFPLTPVAFRDMVVNTRTNTNQTGTTRLHIQPQFNCQDIVLVYTNFYQGPGNTFAPNTNSISVKAALEINGIIYPVFFNGKRTVTIDPGGVIASDPIGGILSTSLSTLPFFVRTYFDAGTGGYVPSTSSFCQVLNQVSDGVTFGSDLCDSGSIANTAYTESYGPSMVLGISTDSYQQKSFYLVGDSIMFGTGDVPQLSGNMGFVARKMLANKIGSTKVAMGGDKASNFLSSIYLRNNFFRFGHSGVICDYGINDISGGVSASTLQSNLLQIWRYFSAKGLKVYQTTYTPVTNSTDNWTTDANQTVNSWESVRLQMNAWLRDTSSNGALAQANGALTGVFDTASKVENNGKWITFPTLVYSGTVQSATANSITDSNMTLPVRSLDYNAVVEITGGTGTGQNLVVSNNAYSNGTITMLSNWATIPDATSTYSIYYIPTKDGTHPSPKCHDLMSQAINV